MSLLDDKRFQPGNIDNVASNLPIGHMENPGRKRMGYSITCPYCFEIMNDDEVFFRSELVYTSEFTKFPDDYDDIDEFKMNYHGADKEAIIRDYEDWEFFREKDDPEYVSWWEKYNGTTETNPADEKLNKCKAYNRKVINPNDPAHQRYLKLQGDGGYLIRDYQGMVHQVELFNGDKCNRRVCKRCHNPLPDNYGKFRVKFAAIIGITGAGKTVYLSQLLKNMSKYASKVGLDAQVTNAGARLFVENNEIKAGKSLPGSTSADRLQQPLIFEMIRNGENNARETETFVLYDVAGEVFRDESSTLVRRFAPFIEHAHGAIVLIDPMQFETISGSVRDGKQLDDPKTALTTIQHVVSRGRQDEKCTIPFAICMSKVDTPEFQNVMNDRMKNLLMSEVMPAPEMGRTFQPLFNAQQYGEIARELNDFIENNDLSLATRMHHNYTTYSYFAFTALGCPVNEGIDESGAPYQFPVGPVLPKRVEEPLLWLFYKFDYIKRNADLPGEIHCPVCDSLDNDELPENERTVVEYEKKAFGLIKKPIEYYVNRICRKCGHKWECQE